MNVAEEPGRREERGGQLLWSGPPFTGLMAACLNCKYFCFPSFMTHDFMHLGNLPVLTLRQMKRIHFSMEHWACLYSVKMCVKANIHVDGSIFKFLYTLSGARKCQGMRQSAASLGDAKLSLIALDALI